METLGLRGEEALVDQSYSMLMVEEDHISARNTETSCNLSVKWRRELASMWIGEWLPIVMSAFIHLSPETNSTFLDSYHDGVKYTST